MFFESRKFGSNEEGNEATGILIGEEDINIQQKGT